MSAKSSKRTSQRSVARRLAGLREEAIDYSDIPPLDDEFFRTAKLLMSRPKKPVALRLDADVLDWLKSQGPGYQSRVNAILRAYMAIERRRDEK
jgi:uncharacterized protein (DUF4415 family)